MGITPSQFQEMQERVAINTKRLSTESIGKDMKACDNERELHSQIAQECVRRQWLAFHGSMAHRTFRTEGEPDFVILCDAGAVLLVECKTRTGKLSMAQLAIRAQAARLSHEVHCVTSFQQFVEIANKISNAD